MNILKYLLVYSLLLLSVVTQSQTVRANRVIVKDAVTLNSVTVNEISTDPTLGDSSATALITEAAVNAALDNYVSQVDIGTNQTLAGDIDFGKTYFNVDTHAFVVSDMEFVDAGTILSNFAGYQAVELRPANVGTAASSDYRDGAEIFYIDSIRIGSITLPTVGALTAGTYDVLHFADEGNIGTGDNYLLSYWAILDHPAVVVGTAGLVSGTYISHVTPVKLTSFNGDVIFRGDVRLVTGKSLANPDKIVTWDNDSKSVGLTDVASIAPDSSVFVTRTLLDDSLAQVRADLAGGGGGGDVMYTNRATATQFFEEFYSTTLAGTQVGWTNSPTGSATSVFSPIAESTAVGTINLRGHATNVFENRLTVLQNIQINNTDFELEIRLRSVHASFGSAGETFYFGFARSTYTAGGTPADGIGFIMNSTGTVGQTNAAGVTSTAFANDVSTTYVVVRITYVQSTGTVEYFVNGVSQGTSTTNIPTDTDYRLDATYATAVGSIGTTAANGGPIIDYVYFKKSLTR